MRGVPIRVCLFAAALAVHGCSGSSSKDSLPTTPTSATPLPVVDLAGTWSGLLNGESILFGLRWEAIRSGTELTGTLVLGPGVRDDLRAGPQPITVNGTMTLAPTGAGNQITVTLSFRAGAFTPIGASSCTLAASGTGNGSATTLSANLTLTWGGTCPFAMPPSGPLSMVKL